jgi:hypothetical protein
MFSGSRVRSGEEQAVPPPWYTSRLPDLLPPIVMFRCQDGPEGTSVMEYGPTMWPTSGIQSPEPSQLWVFEA